MYRVVTYLLPSCLYLFPYLLSLIRRSTEREKSENNRRHELKTGDQLKDVYDI